MKTVRENLHLVWLGLAIAILLVEVLVFWESWNRFGENKQYFDQTRLTVARIRQVVSLLKDAEWAQRGFLITGRAEYVERFRTAAGALPSELAELRRMAETQESSETFSQLESLVTQRLNALAAIASVRQERGLEAAAGLVDTGRELNVTADIEKLAEEIGGRESALLGRRIRETEAAASVAFAVCAVGSGILLLLIIGGTLVIHRDIRRRNTLLDLTRQQAGIIQFAHEAIMVRDLEGRVMSWNTGAAELYGWTEAEARGRHIHTLLWSRLPISETELNAILEREGRWYGEIVQRDRSGRELVVETRQVLVRDTAGEPMGILEMIRDVTGSKRVEDALRKSRERLELVVRSIQLGLFYCDLPFDTLSWDDTCKRHHGVAPDEKVTLDLFYARVHPDDREPTRQAIELSIRGADPCDAVYRIPVPGQLPRWVRLIGKAFYDEAGKPVRFDGVTMDVTAQLRAEEELRESRERLMAALSASGTGTFRCHIASGVVDLDDDTRRILGRPPGGPPVDLESVIAMVHPQDREIFRAAIERASQGAEDIEIEFRIIVADQAPQWVAVKGRTFTGPAGDPIYVTGACLDITERKRHEEEIRQLQKLESIGLLAGGIAHDFNNLLVGIMGNASLAAEILPLAPSERRILDEVLRASECAADLTRQLLAYAGKGRFFLEPVSLSDLIRATSGLVQSSIPKKTRLALHLGEVPPVEADRVQMQQVIMNLMINAGEAIGEDRPGVVRVSTALRRVDAGYAESFTPSDIPPGEYVELEVQDNGRGMDESTLARIFDPFFTTKFTGRGLGLAAVQGIVRSHKGALRVDSSPGVGTVFKLLFPAVGVGVSKPTAAFSADLHGSGLILVIDDELLVRRTAKAALERYGYSVILAEDGSAGVELFRSRAAEVKLVLLDLTMPVLGGEEALEQIRSIRPEVPVLLTSGFNKVEAIRRFTGRGLAGFVQKPYTAVQLACAVKAAIHRFGAAAAGA